jgi:ABC-type lipoprotein export system ATPase subunit
MTYRQAGVMLQFANMILFLTVFKHILMFDIKTLMRSYEKKKRKKSILNQFFMVLPLDFYKDLMGFDHLTNNKCFCR